MKISIRYPVLAQVSGRGLAEDVWALGLKTGEFEFSSATDEEMPIEIDLINRTDNTRNCYRFLTEEQTLYKPAISLDRMEKIERKNFTLSYSDLHPMYNLMKDMITTIWGFRSDGQPVHPDNHFQPFVWCDLDTLNFEHANTAHMAQCERAAREAVKSLIVIDGKLWRKTEEPYLSVIKGRPLWRMSVFDRRWPLMDDQYFFSVQESDKAIALLDDVCANGDVQADQTITVAGRFEYRKNGSHYMAQEVAKGICYCYSNLTSEPRHRKDEYRLEFQSIEMLQAYIDLRRFAEMPLGDITDDDVDTAFATIEVIEREAKKLKTKPPFYSPRRVRQVRDFWDNREIATAINAPLMRPN